MEILKQQTRTRPLKTKKKNQKEAIEGIASDGQLEIVVPRQDEQKSWTANLTTRHASFDLWRF